MTAAGATLATAPAGVSAMQQSDFANTGRDQVPRRKLDKTGLEVSVIGLGGYSLGDTPSLNEAKQIVHEAIDAGVNFFDNAWEYHDGKSEHWMGEALQGRRDKVV